MGLLDGRVAIVTGGGRGLGRSHALQLAAEGARVVVNDIGGAPDGSGHDPAPAEEVVATIIETGGTAVASTEDIGSWDGARRLIAHAIETFGQLDVLVNNAGNVGGGLIVDMEEGVWDDILRVHLKGTCATTHFAAQHWRERSEDGHEVDAAIINTSSASGLQGIFGQTAYGAAKAGILLLTLVSAAELAQFGVRVNVICPAAKTRLTMLTDVTAAAMDGPGNAERYDPSNVSPTVVHLARADCTVTGQVLSVGGGRITAMQGWRSAARARHDAWTPELVAEALAGFPDDLNPLFLAEQLRPVVVNDGATAVGAERIR